MSIKSACRRVIIVSTIGLGLAHVADVSAIDDESTFSYMTLNGFDSVFVDVEGVRRNFKNLGLGESTILELANSELRSAGIEVVDIDTARARPEAAFLRIKLTTNENQYGYYNYGVSVELKRKIALHNPAGGFISGTIWEQGKTGIVMPTELAKINDAIKELLVQFLAAYRAQNPVENRPTN